MNVEQHAGHRRRATIRCAPMALILGALTVPAQAEFELGAEIVPFALKNADGKSVELERADGTLTVQVDEERTQPKALVIHLLQPDCLQCRAQLEALKPIAERYRQRGVITLGIAHRGTTEAVRQLADDLKLTFPILAGVESEIAKRFAAGDTLGIADAQGVIRFAQVGFGAGDDELWEQALDELLAGEAVTRTGVERDRLAAGDYMPAIKLPSLRTSKPMALVGEGGRLVFRDDENKETKPKAAIGFFSRY